MFTCQRFSQSSTSARVQSQRKYDSPIKMQLTIHHRSDFVNSHPRVGHHLQVAHSLILNGRMG